MMVKLYHKDNDSECQSPFKNNSNWKNLKNVVKGIALMKHPEINILKNKVEFEKNLEIQK